MPIGVFASGKPPGASRIIATTRDRGPQAMPRNKPSDEEIELFHQAIGAVTPLDVEPRHHEPEQPSPRAEQSERDEQQVMRDVLTQAYDCEDVQPGDILSYCVPGVTRTVFRKLRRGQYRIERELDLHGFTSDEAQRALSQFLYSCRYTGIRCLRIIHGKGKRSSNDGPVLKSRVNHWLRQRYEVLAFCSARPNDGGTGAIYVLLRAANL